MRASLCVTTIVLLCSAAGPLAATVSFGLDTGRPVVPLTVNGRGPYPFVFDTGSPGLLVMQALVDELGLEITGTARVNSPVSGSAVEAKLARVASIDLGGASVENLEAIVLELDGPGLGMGVVGPALFREQGPLTLDFESDTVTLGGEIGPVQTWLPFGPSAPLLDAQVRIGELSIDAHIDTGSPDVLAVPARFADELPLTGPVRPVGRGRTVDAEFEIRAAPSEGAARVGDAVIPLGEVRLAELPVANLGSGALRGLRLYVDWANERFALSGTAAPSAGPVAQRQVVAAGQEPRRQVVASGRGPRFGVRAAPSPGGAIEVLGTEPGSPAEAIGLVAGDRIVAINGKPTADLDVAQVREELAAEGLELTVERDGETIRLKRSH